MLQNAYFLAKIGADTAENDRNFAENLQRRGRRSSARGRGRPGEHGLLARGPGLRAAPVLRHLPGRGLP